MAKPPPPPPKKPSFAKATAGKKSGTIAGEFLDGVAWVVREAALPIPDTLIKAMKGKKKPKR